MITDAYAERKHQKVIQDTWGHLAPKKGRSYKGYMIWAYGGWGEIVLLEAAFENLKDSPWLFEAMQEYVGEHLDGEGIYKWEGRFEKLDDGYYCFGGKIKRLDFKDIFPMKENIKRKKMIGNGRKVMFNIAQGLHRGFAVVAECEKDKDDGHLLYRLSDVECTSTGTGVDMHNNKQGELWVNDFEVRELPESWQ